MQGWRLQYPWTTNGNWVPNYVIFHKNLSQYLELCASLQLYYQYSSLLMHKILEHNCPDNSFYVPSVQLPGIQSIPRPACVRDEVDCQRRPLSWLCLDFSQSNMQAYLIEMWCLVTPVKCHLLWRNNWFIERGLRWHFNQVAEGFAQWCWIVFSAQNRSCILYSEHELQELL